MTTTIRCFATKGRGESTAVYTTSSSWLDDTGEIVTAPTGGEGVWEARCTGCKRIALQPSRAAALKAAQSHALNCTSVPVA